MCVQSEAFPSRGGMFLWATCPEGVNTNEMMREALVRKMLFVPGCDFFPDASGQRFMRSSGTHSGRN